MKLVSLHCHRTIFLNYFENASFLKIALETLLRRECLSISFVKCKCFYAKSEIICCVGFLVLICLVFVLVQTKWWNIELWVGLAILGTHLIFYRLRGGRFYTL